MMSSSALFFVVLAALSATSSAVFMEMNKYVFSAGVDMFTGGITLQKPGLENPSPRTDMNQCRFKCDDQNECIGFVWDSTISVCALMSQFGSEAAANPAYISAVKGVAPPFSTSGDDYPGYRKLPQAYVYSDNVIFKDVIFSDCPYYCNQTIGCLGYTTSNDRGQGCELIVGWVTSKPFKNPNSDIFARINGPVLAPVFNYYAETGIIRTSTHTVLSHTNDVTECGSSCSTDPDCDGFRFDTITNMCLRHIGAFTDEMNLDYDSVTYIKGILQIIPSWIKYPNTYEYTKEAGYRRTPISATPVSTDRQTCGQICSQHKNCAGFLMNKSKINSCMIVTQFDSKMITLDNNFDTFIKKFGI